MTLSPVRATPAEWAAGGPRARLRRWIGIGAATLAVGVALGWAGSTVLTPSGDVLESTGFTYVEVARGEVSSRINLNAVASWVPVPVGTNRAQGVVTSVEVGPGEEVSTGTTIFTVNLRPVVVAQGGVPGFRALATGTSGTDVAQLQGMLTALGFYSGPADGKFGWQTRQAVSEWQASLGLARDGVVRDGDIVFVPSLPTRISLDEDVKRGSQLGGGEQGILGLPTEPTFSVPVTDVQATLMPLGTRVEITSPSGAVWVAIVVEQRSSEQGGVSLILGGVDGSSICADLCSEVPVTDEARLRSAVVIVEPVEGLIVPSAALLSRADGQIVVVDTEGAAHGVTVIASARGMSVVEGVDAGLRVRIPAEG